MQLVNLRISPYSFLNDRGQTLSGLSFKATGLTPVQASRKAA